MLWNLVLLGGPYIYEIVVSLDNNDDYDKCIVKYGKLIIIRGNEYSLINYKFGKKHGSLKIYKDNNIIEMDIYKYGQLHGESYDATRSGLVISGKYVKNLKCGIWTYKYEDGSMYTMEFVKGDVNVLMKYYYSSGDLHVQGKQIGNKRVGKWYYFTPDGHTYNVKYY